MLKRFSIVLSMVMFAAPIFAAEEEADDPFQGAVSFGYLATTGNTETTSMDTQATATYTTGRWEHEASGQAFTSSQNNATNAEYYTARWRSRWDLTDKDFLFGRLNWRKDRFGAFDTQFSQTIGYGRRVLTGPKHILNLEAGVGARQSEDQLGISDDETIFFGGLDYEWNFSETAAFRQEFTIEAGDTNTFTESKSAISATLVGALSLVASYTIRNNSDVPVGTEKTDTQTGIALEYKF
jgi:putative salt-induced outer membrane protein